MFHVPGFIDGRLVIEPHILELSGEPKTSGG